jgi:hypothetical protein
MNQTTHDVEMLRTILREHSGSLETRVVAIVVAVLVAFVALEAVRRHKLREEFSPIWLTCAAGIVLFAFWFDSLLWVTDMIGAWTPSSAIFFLGLVFLTGVSFYYAVRLSVLADQVRRLAQEVAILRAEQSLDPPESTNP